MKAEEVMTTDVISVPPDATAIEVIDILLTNKISGVPVVDDQRKALGVLSELDLLLALDHVGTGVQVHKLMNSPVISVSGETEIEDVYTIFRDRNIRRVPVLDAEGRVIGIISRRDCLRVRLNSNSVGN
jgi:CBS domain-containing protein